MVTSSRRASSRKKKKARTADKAFPPTDLWLDAQESCDIKLSVVPRHAQEQCCPDPAPLVVFASSQLLSRIPYFAISLSEPWCAQLSETPPSIQDEALCATAIKLRVLTLECASLTSPSDYRLCMQFCLRNKFGFASIDAALSTLRCADHLLFDECLEACMSYLVTIPWSIKDYDAVQQALSSLDGRVKLSSDLAEKLAPTQTINVTVFKDALLNFIRSDTKSECVDFLRKILTNVPGELAQLLAPALMDTWVSFSTNLKEEDAGAWFDLTNILLLQERIEKELQEAFVSSTASIRASFEDFNCITKDAVQILIQFFSRFISCCDQVAHGFSNAQRAHVVSEWVEVVAIADNEELNLAFKDLFAHCLLNTLHWSSW